MSFWWILDLFFLAIGAVVTVVVISSWLTGMSQWESCLLKKRTYPGFYPPWKSRLIEAPPWLALISLILMAALFVSNARSEKEVEIAAKQANERAIAAANASALEAAGLLNNDARNGKSSAMDEKDNLLAVPSPMDTESLKSLSPRKNSVAKKVMDAKKAQDEVIEALAKDNAVAAFANVLVTYFVVLILAFSLTFFFSSKITDRSHFKSTLIFYFLFFLFLMSAVAHKTGGIKIFKERSIESSSQRFKN